MSQTGPLTISGVVEDAAGQPLPHARVYFVSGPAAMPDTALLTGEDGSFTLSAPVAGRYQIGVNADGHQAQTVQAVAGADGPAGGLRLRLAPQ